MKQTARALGEMASACESVGFKPTEAQLRFLAEHFKPPTRRERIVGSVRGFIHFCEWLGEMTLDAPKLAREFWHELRTGQEPAWMALGWGFVAACALGSVALFAVAAQH